MSTQYEVEVTVTSGKNLKNVNWKNGDLRPYVVLWVHSSTKCSTKVDVDNDEDPLWEEKITLPLPGYDCRSAVDDAYLYMDVIHAGEENDVKPLVGSGRLALGEVVEEAGLGGKVTRTVKIKRPSGRPHGKVELEVRVKEKSYYGGQYGGGGYDSRDASHGHYQPPNPYGAPPTGYPYSDPHGAPPPSGYPPYGAPAQHGYPPYGAPPHSGDQYGAPYGGQHYEEEKKKSGMGSGVAMGAAAGLVGGLAIGAGVTYLVTRDDDDEGGEEEEAGGFDDE